MDETVRIAREPAVREAARVARLLARDRADARAERKRKSAEVEVSHGKTVNIADTALRPTPEQLSKSEYREVEFTDKAGRVKQRALKNRGGTTVERWYNRGNLSRGQAEAIALYARAWRLRYEPGSHACMNWSLVPRARGGAVAFEQIVADQLGAKRLLEQLDEAVFFAFPLHYFEVWQRVVIEDEAAGVAGSRLGYKNDGAEAAAKAIVLLLADMIATDLRLGDQA